MTFSPFHCRVLLALPAFLAVLVLCDGRLVEAQETTSPPSLDELLGLEEEPEEVDVETADSPTAEGEDPLEERRREALENRLRERSLAENLVAAVDDMETAAKMLGQRRDPGIQLQRLQLEIIRRLDAVIEEAQQQQQQQQQSASSSSSSSQQQQQVPQKPEQQQEGNQQQQSQQRNNQSGDQAPPSRQEADLQAMFEESSVEWGELPERLRDMIRQGMRESISRMYRRMTEEYYRRIAEEASE